MNGAEHDPRHVHLHGPEAAAPPPDEFDPAHAELAGALRKSFTILKFVMFVLIVLYFMSGFYSVKPDQQAVVLRFGEIVGAGTPDAVKREGWHWSLPFPIDQAQHVKVSEREMDLEFMLYLTPEERATGKIQQKFNNLAPERDDYLVTGDANIIHATLKVKYKIDDAVAYVTNVLPMPNPRRDPKSPEIDSHAEYTLLRNLARDAVISTAARYSALDIRGTKQEEFVQEATRVLNRKLKALADAGAPTGIYISETNGVIATKSKVGSLEAIMPPRQVQEVFDQVFSAQTNKSRAITMANTEAEALLVTTVGPGYQEIARAVDAEYDLVRRLSAANGASTPEVDALKKELAAQREKTEELLKSASGEIRSIIKDAEIERNRIINEAAGDYARFAAVLPEYKRNPEIFISRLLDEARGRALADEGVVKVSVPPNALTYRLLIPRAGGTMQTPEGMKKQADKKKRENLGTIPRGEIRKH